MNRYEYPMGLGYLSLILFGLSFVMAQVIKADHGAPRLAEPDVLNGPSAYATALVVVAFFAFFTRLFYLTELLAVPGFVIAVASALPWIWDLHIGMILWVASMPCLVIAAYRCDGYRERALHPHPTSSETAAQS